MIIFQEIDKNWNIFSIYTDKVSQTEYIKEFAGAKFNFLVTASPEWQQQNFSIIVVLSVDLFFTDFMTKMMRQL